MDEHAIVKSGIVMPAVTSDEAVAAFQAYQDLAKKITLKEDIQMIKTSQGARPFKKKSFWRKVQRYFNLSVEITEERKEEHGDGEIVYHFKARAIAPNGAFMDGTGSCSSMEKEYENTEHNTRATAETRAKNRAISDLVAFGEVSAEEVMQGEPTKTTSSDGKISEKQRKRLFAISKSKGLTEDDVKNLIKGYGYEKTADINWKDYDKIIEEIEAVEATEEQTEMQY